MDLLLFNFPLVEVLSAAAKHPIECKIVESALVERVSVLEVVDVVDRVWAEELPSEFVCKHQIKMEEQQDSHNWDKDQKHNEHSQDYVVYVLKIQALFDQQDAKDYLSILAD